MTYQITSTRATFSAVMFDFKFLIPYFQSDIAVSCMEGALVSFSTESPISLIIDNQGIDIFHEQKILQCKVTRYDTHMNLLSL